MAAIITVTPNPLLNFVCDASITAGAVNRVPALRTVAEGKGVNVARVLAAHGHAVAACGFAGGASGALEVAGVREYGVEPDFTETAARLRIGFQAGAADDHHPTTLLEHGFAVTPAEGDDLLDRVAARLAATDLVIASGSVPDPGLEDLYARLLARCHEAGVTCWIDAYGPVMAAALAGDHPPALVKPNREEHAGIDGWQRAAECHVSDGAAGIDVRTPAGAFRTTPPRITQVNPVGSGDSYLAALAHARLAGWETTRQLAYAAAAGAANAARADVAAMAPDEIEHLADRAVVEAV